MVRTTIKFADETELDILGINVILGRLIAVIKDDLTEEEVVNLFTYERTKKITHLITNQEWEDYVFDEIVKEPDLLSICMKKAGEDNV